MKPSCPLWSFDQLISFLLISAGLLFCFPLCGHAQTPEIIVEESRGIEGFELYENGLYYYLSNGASDDLIYVKNYRFDPGSPNSTRLGASNAIVDGTNVTRNSQYFFRAVTARRIQRSSSINTTSGSDLVDIASIANSEITALNYFNDNDFLYFGLRSTDGSGDYGIYAAPDTADNADIMVSDAIGLGSTAAGTSNFINKLEVFRYGPSGALGIAYLVGPKQTSFGERPPCQLFLKTAGSSFLSPGTLLETNVTDFSIARTGPFPDDVTIYATKFIGLIRSENTIANSERGTNDVGGYVLEIVPETGVVSEKYYDVGASVYSVTTDDLYYYFVQKVSGVTTIQRQLKTANGEGSSIEALSSLAFNLRSDDEWLYYIQPRLTTGHSIKRLARNAAPITMDVVARSIEAIQTTQALPEGTVFEIPLIEGKDTVVRAYGDLENNSTGQPNWLVDARLRLYDDGVLIEEFQPRNLATLSAFSGPENTRLNFDLRNPTNFFFNVPGQYIREGSMEFELSLNESEIAPETDTLINNKTSATYTVRKSGIQVLPPPFDPETPSIIFRPINVSDQPIIRLRNVANLPTLIERAKAYLPFADVTVEEVDDVLRKEILFIDLGGFGIPSEQNWALLNLSVSTLTSNYLFGNVQVAMVPRTVSNFNGVAFPITATLVRMEPSLTDTTFTEFNRPRGALSLAHEWGHIAGILHINNVGCGNQPEGPYEPSNPWSNCNIGSPGVFSNWVGFDPITRTVIPPDDAGDLMSYRFPRWISGPYYADSRWQEPANINAGIRESIERGDPAEQLVIGALYDSVNDSYRFTHFYIWPGNLIGAPEFPEPEDAGFDKHTISLKDSSDNVLTTKDIIPFPVAESDTDTGVLYGWIPWDPNTAFVEIEVNGTPKATIGRSSNPPDVVVADPVIDNTDEVLRLSWNAYDPDGDPILTHVLYSNDNGDSWENRVMQTPLHGVEIPLENLPGGPDCRIKLIFSDGMNTVIEDLGPLNIPTHAPEIFLDGPPEGATVPYGETVCLIALALDPDQGSLPGSSLEWEIIGREILNFTGSKVLLDDLAPGSYTVNVSAMDDDGQTGMTTRNFDVAPLTIPEATSPPVLDGNKDDVYSEGSYIKVPYVSDNGYFEARLIHSDNNLYVCFEGLQFIEGSNSNRQVGLLIDLDSSGDNPPSGSDVGFIINEFGVPGYYTPAGGNYVPEDFLPEGFTAVVSRTGSSFSAELCISDDLIGGWNNLVGLQIIHIIPDIDVWPAASGIVETASYGAAWFGDPASAPTPPALLPIANAGEDRKLTVLTETSFYLDGTSSSDPNGNGLTYQWTQTGGPNVTLMEDDKEVAFFKTDPGNEEKVYTFELTVMNTEGSDTDSVEVSLAPHPAPFIFNLNVILNNILGIEKRPADSNQDDKVDSSDVEDFLDGQTIK